MTTIVEFALGQQMALKNRIDGLQVEFRGHIAHRAIFVIELLVPIRTFTITFHKVREHRPMAHHMIAQVHRHKARKLQKARIYAAASTFVIRRDRGDYILHEPFVRPLGCVIVHCRWRFARINRPAHHRQRARTQRMLLRRHNRRSGIGRNRWLADREHMRAAPSRIWAKKFQPLNQIINIGFKVEPATRQRHIARVLPIGDIDIIRAHHPFDGATQ